jgi:uncharacterized membrane protein YhaH (DUF805 family)
MNKIRNFFDPNGRNNRSKFFYLFLANNIVSTLIMTFVLYFLIPFAKDLDYERDSIMVSYFVFNHFLYFLLHFRNFAKRFHDFNYGGGYPFLGLIPLGYFFLFFIIVFIPGNGYKNSFDFIRK